jgi:hypothetical protein
METNERKVLRILREEYRQRTSRALRMIYEGEEKESDVKFNLKNVVKPGLSVRLRKDYQKWKKGAAFTIKSVGGTHVELDPPSEESVESPAASSDPVGVPVAATRSSSASNAAPVNVSDGEQPQEPQRKDAVRMSWQEFDNDGGVFELHGGEEDKDAKKQAGSDKRQTKDDKNS